MRGGNTVKVPKNSYVKAAIKYFETPKNFEMEKKSLSVNTNFANKKKISYIPEIRKGQKNINPYALVSVDANSIPEPKIIVTNPTSVSISKKPIKEVVEKNIPQSTNSIRRAIGFYSDPTRSLLNYKKGPPTIGMTYEQVLLEDEKKNLYPQIDYRKVRVNNAAYNQMGRETFMDLKKALKAKNYLFEGESGKTDYSNTIENVPNVIGQNTYNTIKKKGYKFTTMKSSSPQNNSQNYGYIDVAY
jgi:hypothetical protein